MRMEKFKPENYFTTSLALATEATLSLMKYWAVATWTGWAWVIDPQDGYTTDSECSQKHEK